MNIQAKLAEVTNYAIDIILGKPECYCHAEAVANGMCHAHNMLDIDEMMGVEITVAGEKVEV